MTIEQTGPGGVNRSFGQRNTLTTRTYSTESVYGDTFKEGGDGPAGGTADFTPTNRFKTTVFKTTSESLQEAVDRAAALGPTVTRLTGPTARVNNTYAFTFASKPTKVFLDADELREQANAFTGGVFDGLGSALVTNNVWYWEASTSSVVVYDRGNAVTSVVAVDPVAVVALDAPSYEAVVLQPGIWVVGMGPEFSSIRRVAPAIHEGDPLLKFYFSVATAQYAGVSGFRVIHTQSDKSVTPHSTGLLFPIGVNSDGFTFERSELLIESGVASPSTTEYCAGVFFAPGSNTVTTPTETEPRAKGVIFRSSTLRSDSRAWVMETLSGAFKGTVTFIDTPIHGNWFLDGRLQTFKFFNCPMDNYTGEGLAHPELSNLEALSFMNSTVGPSNCSKWPSEAYAIEFHNSPIGPKNAANNNGSSDGDYTTIAYDGLYPIYVNNSSIGGEVSFAAWGLAALTPAKAELLASRNSRITPLKLTTFSTSNKTPLVPVSYVDATVNTSGSTERFVGQMRISHDELKRRGKVVVSLTGSVAANANTKTFNMYMGEAVSGTTLQRTAGITTSGTPFRAVATVLYQNGGIVTVELTSSNLGTFTGVFQHTGLVSGEDFVLSFGVQGTATNDITLRMQRIEIDG